MLYQLAVSYSMSHSEIRHCSDLNIFKLLFIFYIYIYKSFSHFSLAYSETRCDFVSSSHNPSQNLIFESVGVKILCHNSHHSSFRPLHVTTDSATLAAMSVYRESGYMHFSAP